MKQSIDAFFAAPVLLKCLFLLLGILLLYLVLSALFSPMMYVYNRMTDKNQSNVDEERTYYLGEITVKITGDGYGEVLDLEHKSLYPARLFQQNEQEEGMVYAVGEKVLIIEFDQEKVARVVKNNQFLESRKPL